MNAAALLIIIVSSIGKVSATDLQTITTTVSGKHCAANDGKCVADVINAAKDAVKAERKASKKGSKLCNTSAKQ